MWDVVFIENKTKRTICYKQTKMIPAVNDMIIIENQSCQVCYIVFDYDKLLVSIMINKEDV